MKKSLIYLFLGANMAAVATFWWSYSGQLLSSNPLLALGRLSGLFLAFAALFQVFLMSRASWVERYFGFDRMAGLHRVSGYSMSALLLAHPILLALGYGKFTDKGFWPQIFTFINSFEDVFIAVIGFLLFLAVIFLSISIVRRKMAYETWYLTHIFVYVAIALSFPHQAAVGADLGRSAFLIYWYALYVFVFGNLLIFRFGLPVYNFFKHRFAVKLVDAEAEGIFSIYIGGKDIKKFKFKGGQFLKLRFLAKKIWKEEHPFSISARPNGEYVRITIKALGDFTSAVRNIESGTPVLIGGPYGLFTADANRKDKIILIAGGIGITPILPLLSEFAEKGKNIILFYGNRKEAEVAFKKDIDILAEKYSFVAHYVMSDDSSWAGERGRIDLALIKRLAPDFLEREIYICGPELMRKSLESGLLAAGIKKEDLHREDFSY